MADVKISELTALASANVDASGDVLAVVDTSATATRKITVENLLAPITINKASNVITNLGTVSAATSITSSAFVGPLTGNVTGNVSGTAPAGTLTGSTLASGVTASSLTSVDTLTGLTSSSDVLITGGNALQLRETDTYINSPSSDRIDFRTDGTVALFLDSSQNATFAGTINTTKGIRAGTYSASNAFTENGIDNLQVHYARFGGHSNAVADILYNAYWTGSAWINDNDSSDSYLLRLIDGSGLTFQVSEAGATPSFTTKFSVTNAGVATFTGNVGIGTGTIANESEHYKLKISGASGTGAGIIEFADGSDNIDGAIFSDGGNLFIVADRDNATADSSIRFRVDGSTERMRIDSAGNVGIGTANIVSELDVYGSTADGTLPVSLTIKGYNGEYNNSPIGALDFYNVNNSVGSEVSSRIQAYTHSSSATGGFLTFSTRTGGNPSGSLTERMRIDPTGNVGFNTTGTPNGTSIYGSAFVPVSYNRSRLAIACSNAGDLEVVQFFNPNGQVGSISTHNSGTAFTTSSDYRLKENEVAILDGITRLKQLKPYRFNFKADADTTLDGFFAHEVQEIVPEAISGQKDAVDENGDIESQGIDQSKLVPLLVSALQEAIERIEILENA